MRHAISDVRNATNSPRTAQGRLVQDMGSRSPTARRLAKFPTRERTSSRAAQQTPARARSGSMCRFDSRRHWPYLGRVSSDRRTLNAQSRLRIKLRNDGRAGAVSSSISDRAWMMQQSFLGVFVMCQLQPLHPHNSPTPKIHDAPTPTPSPSPSD